MKKRRILGIISLLILVILFGILSLGASGKNFGFPYEKAKQAAISSIRGGATVIGWHYEGNGKVIMYLFGSDGSRWQRTFVLLESEKGKKWLMIIPPFGSLDAKFKVIK